MSTNLNESLYKRFDLDLQVNQVKTGFERFLKNSFEETLGPLTVPDAFQDSQKLSKMQRSILLESCRQMFFDLSKYQDWDYGFSWFVNRVFDGDFPEIILRVQILINLVYRQKFLRYELIRFAEQIGDYLEDYPILGLTVKIYKTKSPQILPTTSKIFEKEIKNTLGLLETDKKYSSVIEYFEKGLKEFLQARNSGDLKDVVEDMYASCDESVQIITGSPKYGFRNVFVGKSPINVGLNNWQFKIYSELKDWMDKIKHGSEKKFTKEDVEQIILLSSTFIRNVVNNNTKKS